MIDLDQVVEAKQRLDPVSLLFLMELARQMGCVCMKGTTQKNVASARLRLNQLHIGRSLTPEEILRSEALQHSDCRHRIAAIPGFAPTRYD